MIETGIDYLQYSIDIAHCPIDSASVKVAPMRTYKSGYRGSWGETIYLGNSNSNKPLVVMSATAIYNWAQHIDTKEMIEDIVSKGAKISRIDWQVTQFVTDDLIQPIDYAEYQRAGKITTKETWNKVPKVIGEWAEKEIQVETLMFGDMKQRGKHGMVRVYDKGIDLGTYANSIIRTEIEEKRGKAHKSVLRYLDGHEIGSIIRSRFDIDDDRWQAMINSTPIDITRGKAIETEDEVDTWNWLITQVAKSLGRAIADEVLTGKTTKFDYFNQLVANEYNTRIQSVLRPLQIENEIQTQNATSDDN